MDVKATLDRLCGLHGPSGAEGPVSGAAAGYLGQYCDEVTTDRLGNVFGVRKAKKEGAPKVMIAAHIDEIGFMVTKLEEGFLRFRNIGGIDPRVLPARDVTVLSDPPVFGVITSIPPHLQGDGDRSKTMEQDSLFIDIGMSQEEAEKLVRPGTYAVYREKLVSLGDKQVSGKTLDDRCCFVMLLRMLELLEGSELDAELIVMASVQEEVGTRGAQVGGYSQAPDYAIAVDVTMGETPDAPKGKTLKLGGGVPISLGPNTNRKLARRLIDLAEKKELGWQPEVMEGRTGTDAWPMQVAGNGAATVIVSVPLKYMHTAIETISLDDIESGAKLLAEFMLSFCDGGEADA